MPSYPSAFRFCPFCGHPLGPPTGVDLAQVCQTCDGRLFHGSKPGVGVVIVRSDGNAVLLIRRRWPPYRGRWGLPGGFVVFGELPSAAAVREVREETSLEVRPERLLLMRIETYPRPQGADRLLSLYYLAEVVGGCERAGDEVEALGWFEWDALPSRLAGRYLAGILDAARAAVNLSRGAPID
jgi:8-oxo-dGTP diphosphatase